MTRRAARVMGTAVLALAVGCSASPPANEVDQTPRDAATTEPGTGVLEADVERVPLAREGGPAAGAQGTLLTALRSDETGLSHQNFLPRERQARFLVVGAGVAAGDYDGDGLPDVWLSSEMGDSHLYRNLGDWQFEDVTEEAGLVIERMVSVDRWDERFPTGAHFADVDNDGDLDLYVTAFAGAAMLFRNEGDGTFTDATAQAGVGYVGASTTSTFGDYDRDGDLDLYVATYRPFAESKYYPSNSGGPEPELDYDLVTTDQGHDMLAEADVLYRNRGDGTFEEVSTEAGIAGRDFGLAASFADANGDGWPDLYVSNDFATPDRFYVNRGDGTFAELTAAAMRHTPWFSMGMDFGDVNNDGHLDLMTSDMLSPNRVRRQTQSHEMMAAGARATEDDTATQIMRNTLMLNHGDGSFSDIAPFAGLTATDWTWTVKFVDLDLDGRQDVLVTNGYVSDDMNADEAEEIARLRSEGTVEQVWERMRSRPRLLTPNLAFRGTGEYAFEETGAEWGFDDDSIAHGLALADFDVDGDLDVVTNNMNRPAGLYRNDAVANRVKVALTGTTSNRYGIGAKLTLDGPAGTQFRELSTSGGYMSSHEPVAVFGLGDAEEAGTLTVEWPSGIVTVVEDVTANTQLNITEPNAEPAIGPALPAPPSTQFEDVASQVGVDFVHEERLWDDFGEQPSLPMRLSQFGPGVAWGDVNADGYEDLYVVGGGREPGALYVNREGASFDRRSGPEVPGRLEEQAALFLPAGDGGTDLVVTYSHLEEREPGPHTVARRFAVTEDGVGAELWSTEAAASGGAAAAADVDGDGALDLFLAGRVRAGEWPLPVESQLVRGTDGGFEPAGEVLLDDALVTGAVWTDVDDDADPDLALATEWGPVRLFVNDGGRLRDATEQAGLADHTGLWRGISAGDVDHDSDVDLVVSNVGLNTRHTAAPGQPLVLFAGDVDDDGDIDVIETEWDDGRLYPFRNRMETADDVADVWERFDTWLAFARADVEEIFGAGLENATRFEASTLEHTLFVNDGSGRFEALSLPVEAQMLAGYGVTVADLDADGHDDIYMVGNFRGNEEMHTGPFHGGVSSWLRGDGAGGFEKQPVVDSGLSVPGDAKGVAAGDFDLDGWVDLAVGVNSGAVKLFRNGGVRDAQGLVVRLEAGPDTPGSVGARVSVTRPDGVTITKEVHAGSSFLSQDGAALVFGLGAAGGPVGVTVRWPDGSVQVIDAAAGGDVLVVQQEDA